MGKWKGEFGRAYTERNCFTVQTNERKYHELYSVGRREMNDEFIGSLDRSARILEVGANAGVQLAALKEMGFYNLFGVEILDYAIAQSKTVSGEITIIKASAFDLPFPDGFFDLVYTSGVLIHIAPIDIDMAMREIHRCSRRYIWGFEYYSDLLVEIPYRGESGLLWKANYARMYLDTFGDLRLVRRKQYSYNGHDEKIDEMFLLEKWCEINAERPRREP
jgi:pseudaminic acid biosynthesis-associated methylase